MSDVYDYDPTKDEALKRFMEEGRNLLSPDEVAAVLASLSIANVDDETPGAFDL